MSTQRRILRSTMLYSKSGDTKTSQCYHMFRYYHRKTGCPAKRIRDCPGVPECKGKRARIINADPGQSITPYEDTGLIKKGIVAYYNLNETKYPLADTRKLALGYWPKDEEIRAEPEFMTSPEDFHNIWGCYIVEGASSMAEMWLSHMRKLATGGEKGGGIGYQPSYFYEEDGESYSGLQRGHYQLPQEELRNIHIHGLSALPIDNLIWTALVGKGLDKEKGEDCFAPQGAGSADNFKIPSWFGDCIHLDRIPIKGNDGMVREQVVAWLMNHKDEEGVKYLAKVRLAPEKYPTLLEKFPEGYVKMDYTNGMARYLLEMEKIREGG